MSDIKPIWDPVTVFWWRIVKVVHQDMNKNEKIMTYEWAERSPWVRLIIRNNEWKICLTKEHRIEINWWLWWFDFRLPGGKVIDTLWEYDNFLESWWDIRTASKDAAVREAKEEVGVAAEHIDLIHISWCGTTMRWDLYYYEMKTIKIWHQELDGMEHIDVERYSVEEVKTLCLDWSIQEDRSVAVLLRYIYARS